MLFRLISGITLYSRRVLGNKLLSRSVGHRRARKECKMDESSKPLSNATEQYDKSDSGLVATSTPIKRTNPYREDRPDVGKRRKIEQSVNESKVQTKQYFPIVSLQPTFTCTAIKGTLVTVSELKTRGQVQSLTFRLKDESGEICGVVFAPMSQSFFKNFKRGATIIVEKAKVEPQKAGYQAVAQPYRLMIDKHCSVQFESVPSVQLKLFRKTIKYVHDSSIDHDVVDVVGILENVGEVKSNSMREIRIVDESEANIVITLWDYRARNFNAPLQSVIAAHRVAVRSFNGIKALRTCHLSELMIDPPIGDTPRLKKWYRDWKAAAEAIGNENSPTVIRNTLTSPKSRGNENSKMVIESTSALPKSNESANCSKLIPSTLDLAKTDQEQYIPIKKILEEPVIATVATVGQIVALTRPKIYVMKTGTVPYGRELTLRHDGSEILVQVMGREVLTKDLPLFSFATVRNATLLSDGTKKLICGWENMRIISDASEVERLLRLFDEQPQLKKIRRELSPITKAEAVASSTVISRVKTHEASSTVVERCSSSTGAENTGNSTGCLPKASSTFVSASSCLVNRNFTPISTIKERIAVGKKIDVVGLVVKQKPPIQRQTNAGKLSWMRALILADQEHTEIELAVWGGDVSERDIPLYSVVMAKNVTVRKYNDIKTLTCICMHLQINPNIPQTEGLRKLIANYSATNETEDSDVAGTSVVPDHSLRRSHTSWPTDFTPINEIKDIVTAGSTCNVVGLVIKRRPVEERRTKAGNPSWMRVVILADDKNSEIEMTVWGNEVKDHDVPIHSVITARNVKVQEYIGDKTLNTLWINLQIDPNIPQTEGLRKLIADYSVTNETEDSDVAGPSIVPDHSLRRNESLLPTNFTPINEIKDRAAAGSKCNVVGVVIKREPAEERQTKAGKLTWMKVIMLADNWNSEIELAVWGNGVEDHDIPINSVITARNAIVREYFGDKTLSCLWMNLQIDPNIPQTEGLRKLIANYSATNETEDSDVTGLSIVPDHSLRRNESSLPTDFTSINKIKDIVTAGSKRNVIGLVIKREPAEERQTKAGKLTWMRVVMLADNKNSEIKMTVWGNEVKDHDIPIHSVITARNVKVQEYIGDKTLSTLWINLQINPNIPQTEGLRKLIADYSVTNETEDSDVAGPSIVPDHSLRRKEFLLPANFTPINEIKDKATAGSKCNVVGLVIKREPAEERQTKAGNLTWMRVVMLADNKNSEIELAVWGNGVEDHDIPINCVITAKNVVVREYFGDKTLNCLWMNLQIDPNIPQTEGLRKLIADYSVTIETEDSDVAGPSVVPDHSLRRNESLLLTNFTPINEIKDKATAGSTCNVVGLVIKREPAEVRRIKVEKPSWMRVVILADDKNSEIEMAVWGNEVKDHDIPIHSVIAARNVKVREYIGDKTLSTLWINLQIDPNIPQTEGLRKLIADYLVTNKTEDSDVAGLSIVPDHSLRRNEFLLPTNFTPINDIKDRSTAGSKCNVVGLVIKREPAEEWQTKAGKLTWMRVIMLADNKNSEIKMAVWGNEVKDHDIPIHSVVTASNVAVREYFGHKTLSCLWMNLQIDPNIPQTEGLRELIANYPVTNETEDSDVAGPSVVPDHNLLRSDDSLPTDFMLINEIKDKLTAGSKCNVVGLVIECKPAEERRTKAGNPSWMRVFILADDKNSEIEMAVWGDEVKKHNIPIHSVIIARNAMVREYTSGKTLSCLWAHLQINPNIPQTAELKKLIANFSRTRKAKTSVVRGSSPVKNAFYFCRNQFSQDKMVFTPINEIHSETTLGPTYNIVGAVVALESPTRFTTKTGNVLDVRVVVVADEENSQTDMTVWGEEVVVHDIPLHSVIIARNVTVREFNYEKTLSCLWTHLQINPDIPQVAEIKKFAESYTLLTKEPKLPSDYHPFEQIKTESNINSKWHVIGFVGNVVRPRMVTSRDENNLWMCRVKLRDSSFNAINMTVWCEESLKNAIPRGSVMAVKFANMRKFNCGLSLNAFWNNVTINPDIPAAQRLKELRKIELISRWPNYRVFADDESSDYTPIDVIKRRNKPGDFLNLFGLVVELNPPEIRQKHDRKICTRKCVLRGKDRSEIELNICAHSSGLLDISMHSVIVARDATLQFSKNEEKLTLACRRVNIDVDIEIPETKGFKEDVLNAVQLENPVAPDPNNFTAIGVIKEKTPLGTTLNVIGLVVNVIKRTGFADENDSYIANCTLRVTLRDKDRELIALNIRKTPSTDKRIKLDSVIAVRDATLRLSGDDKVLWCLWESVEVNPIITQAEGLAKLAEIPFVRGFMPFKTIEREPSLIGCKMDFIGQITEILPPVEITNCNGELQSVGEFIMRNEIEMKLRVLGYYNRQRSTTGNDAIRVNTVVAAKNALLIRYRTEIMFSITRGSLIINPKIPEDDRAAKSLGVLRIDRIIEEAEAGDKLGVLAVVLQSPRKTFWIRKKTKVYEVLDDEDIDVHETAMYYVKLIDSSEKTINMKISPSIIDDLRENGDKTVVVRARNVKVCCYLDTLELACITPESRIEVNPKTKNARELIEWYDDFCKKKEEELRKVEKAQQVQQVQDVQQKLSITPISLVLENFTDNTVASIMGILVETDMREVDKAGKRFLCRRIRIVDESEEAINILLWTYTAKNFRIPLYSVILVRKFCFYTRDANKWGVFGPNTDWVENPSDEENLQGTERLQTWFARCWTQFQNPNVVSAAGSAQTESPIHPSNDIEMVENAEEVRQESKSLFGSDDSLTINNNDAMECDSSSPDLFADC